MGPTGAALRVLQLHVSKRCNLACSHCYSSSGPQHKDKLPLAVWQGVIEDAAALGYNVVGFSGGEPLMFKPLRSLLLQARSLGMTTTVTTNGMLLDARRIGELSGAANLVAISLDGAPAAHNRMRGHPKAFEKMAARLPGLREAGIPFGFIFTLTQFNLDELIWASEFAVQQGAALLQIHPLEPVGRATQTLAGAVPDETELAYAVIAVARLKALVGDRLTLQLDVAGRDALAAFPERVFAAQTDGQHLSLPLGQWLSPLIVEPDGTVVPVEYDFGRRWALGQLQQDRLASLAPRWVEQQAADFLALCCSVQQQAVQPDQPAVINWYARLAKLSAQARTGVPTAASATTLATTLATTPARAGAADPAVA